MGMGDSVHREKVLGNEKRNLIFLLVFALALRILLYKWTYLIAIDGTGFYLKPAQYFASGQWMDGLAIGYHPLYPMLVAAFSKVLGDFELSGQMVSILFGTLTVVPVYYLARGTFGRWTALASSLFLAILPRHVALSADFLSDPTYTFFFISAVWLGWEALRRDDWKIVFLAGLATGLAYLTRAEGIGILPILGPWLLLRRMHFHSRDYRRNGYACFILLFSFLLAASPYIIYLRYYTGTWTISRKPAVDRVVVLIKTKLFFQKPKVAKATEEFDDIVQRLAEKGKVSDATGFYMPEHDCWWPNYFGGYGAYMASMRRLAGLGAEVLCLSHNAALKGAEAVKDYFDRAIAATEACHRRIVDEIKAGKPVRQLAEELGAEVYQKTQLLPLEFFQKNCGLLVKLSLKHEGIAPEKKG